MLEVLGLPCYQSFQLALGYGALGEVRQQASVWGTGERTLVEAVTQAGTHWLVHTGWYTLGDTHTV